MQLTGSDMEVNISHGTREGILSTTDLAHSNVFNCAISELLQLMKMVRYLHRIDDRSLSFRFSLK